MSIRQPPSRNPSKRRQTGDLEKFRRRLADFQRGFAQSFGYEMHDPFADICTMLAAGTAFSYSRFGDGEFKAIFGADGMNCDGHRFFPDLGQRLTEILEGKPDYTLGLLPQAVRVHGVERILALSGDIRWVLANSLHLALLDGRLGAFFEALAGNRVVLVGPEHLHEFSVSRGWEYVQVPSRDCWTRYDDVSERTRDSLAKSGDVVLFCASMMSNAIIDDLHCSAPTNTYIDVGSVFDPFCGINSRAYHDALDADMLKVLNGLT